MNYMKYVWFILAFAVSAFAAGIITPFVPNMGNPMLQIALGYAVPAIILLLVWEKFFKKQAGA
jgi:membrane protein implicated in regulation of membrane protease activity